MDKELDTRRDEANGRARWLCGYAAFSGHGHKSSHTRRAGRGYT